jgi:5,6-dimethylbenzimidazole synthase
MPSPSCDAVVTEVVLEGDVHRAGKVAAFVVCAAVRRGKLPANVQNRQRHTGSDESVEFGCRDQHIGAHTHERTLASVGQHAFSADERRAVYRVIAERRDMRRFIPGAVVADDVLARLLAAAHAAPSVGLMQPWRFIRITDTALRRQIHGLVDEERHHTALALGSRGEEFLSLKVEGALDCAELVVVALGDQRGQHVFGRRTLPHMDLASVSCAIQNLWLAARAEGLGMGWVSIFDPDRLGALLGMPDDAEPVAILCLGPVPEFPDRPVLEIDQWAFGLPLADFVSENGWPSGPAVGSSPCPP